MPAVPYKTSDYLKTPQAIVEYLKLVLEDPESDHEDLLVAVRNVCGLGLTADHRTQVGHFGQQPAVARDGLAEAQA